MTVKLFFCIRTEPGSNERIPINGLNLDHKVEYLKDLAAERTKIPNVNLDLVFCGNILENQSTLESCGIRPGVTIHVLKKKEPEVPRKVTPICEADILHLVSAFKSATKNPNYRSALQRLSRPDVLDNIAVATPGLAEDPVALAIIQDPELLTQLCDASTVRRVVEAHPALAEAAHYIVAVVHEEAHSHSANPGTSSGYSYSLDALSDDEEIDSSQSSDSQPRTSGGETITTAQLAAALATASANNNQEAAVPEAGAGESITTAQLAAALASAAANNNQEAAVPETGATGANNNQEGGLITVDMFNQAMQQAFAQARTPAQPAGEVPATTASGDGNDRGDRGDGGGSGAWAQRLSSQLQQMHELGLLDDAVNLQALQTADWNVQEAINLVFSGAIGDGELGGE